MDHCSICSLEITKINSCTVECGHRFHLTCIGSLIACSGNMSACPNCRAVNLTGKDISGKYDVEDLTERFSRILDVPPVNLEDKINRLAFIDRTLINRATLRQQIYTEQYFFLVLNDIGGMLRVFKLGANNHRELSTKYQHSAIFNDKFVKVYDTFIILPQPYEQLYLELVNYHMNPDTVEYARIFDSYAKTDSSNTKILVNILVRGGNVYSHGTELQFVRGFQYTDRSVASALNNGYKGCTWVFTSGINKDGYCFRSADNAWTETNPLLYRCVTCATRKSASLCFQKLYVEDGVVHVR